VIDPERATAIHEAGHAIAAIRAGLVFDTVSAIPDELNELDGALYWDELQESGQLVMEPQLLAVVLLAGPCAEARDSRRRFDEVFEDEEAAGDRESMATLELTADEFIAASREAVALIECDWALIEAVARGLTGGRRMTFAEVDAIVAAGDRRRR
jgi:hypothetical protein